jgi:hypothetical protein
VDQAVGIVTEEGFERIFARYRLSRYLLGHEPSPLLRRSATPVFVNVAGIGVAKGSIHRDDLKLERGYGTTASKKIT